MATITTNVIFSAELFQDGRPGNLICRNKQTNEITDVFSFGDLENIDRLIQVLNIMRSACVQKEKESDNA